MRKRRSRDRPRKRLKRNKVIDVISMILLTVFCIGFLSSVFIRDTPSAEGNEGYDPSYPVTPSPDVPGTDIPGDEPGADIPGDEPGTEDTQPDEEQSSDYGDTPMVEFEW